MKNQRGAGASSACALRTVPSRPVFPDCAGLHRAESNRPKRARRDEIAELLQEYMEVRRGLGGARQNEWLAAAGGDSPFVCGLFREPTDGEAAIVAFWSRAEQGWSLVMVCQHFLTNLWLSVVEPAHVFEWPDEDVLVLSAASRMV